MNYEFLDRLRSVEHEYVACRAALEYAIREWPNVFDSPEWTSRGLGQAQEALRRLEDTYVIRLFSEFEAVLREYWLATVRSAVPVRVDTLMNRLGSRHRVPAQIRAGAHAVQHHRNALVHCGAPAAARVALGNARRALNRFLAVLPDV